jgi:hypothetical protein
LFGVRSLVALCGLLAATVCQADQLITIPTAAKTPFGDVRLDFDSAFNGRFGFASANFGVGRSFEATLRGFEPSGRPGVATFDFEYNYLTPIAGIIPGVCVGVQDGLGTTPDGRRYYVALTSRQIYSTASGDASGDVTIGLFGGKRASGFLGFSLPLTTNLRLLAEHNGYRISAGFELRPTPSFGFRLLTVDSRPVVGITTVTRF